MSPKRKELIVSAITNGTVIDHIPTKNVFQVIKILGLDKTTNQVYFGTNLESKKFGSKGIIKIWRGNFRGDGQGQGAHAFDWRGRTDGGSPARGCQGRSHCCCEAGAVGFPD